ncbi:PREDICTED: protein CutA isoform X3 [Galeopterus variegatus]|uniref:Protein CutA isoform X3 n=1 Tax=Galeopterus variegatus TaxID=482537 RepID=A0ABM0RNR3_GALVR|nr:PREDICTED: protein CutA isoform X3 [Galeopterus variegatus]
MVWLLLSRGVRCFLITWLPPSLGCMGRGRAPAILLGGGAALLLSFLWMPALLPVASRLLLLPRSLMIMASGSTLSQPSPASGSGYVPGSVSAAFVTCPNEKVAKEIASFGSLSLAASAKLRVTGCSEWGCLFTFRAVVEKRLAACVNLIPQITSISVHPYEVAEVIALPVEQGNSPYLHWVRQVTESVSDSSTVLP